MVGFTLTIILMYLIRVLQPRQALWGRPLQRAQEKHASRSPIRGTLLLTCTSVSFLSRTKRWSERRWFDHVDTHWYRPGILRPQCQF